MSKPNLSVKYHGTAEKHMEVETLAYSKSGEPPRPLTCGFMIDHEYMQCNVKKVRERKIIARNQ